MERFITENLGPPIEESQEILLTLFVGAIGNEATSESIAEYFEGFGKVNKVKIIVDWATKQSKECALVYFTSQDSVRKVMSFPKHIIDGRVVRVEPADRTKKGTKVVEANALLVSNISHLHLHREVLEYFAFFGQITSCKFFKERSVDGESKTAIIHFEKSYSLERVFASGSEHLVGGRLVFCSSLFPPPEGGLLQEATRNPKLPLLLAREQTPPAPLAPANCSSQHTKRPSFEHDGGLNIVETFSRRLQSLAPDNRLVLWHQPDALFTPIEGRPTGVAAQRMAGQTLLLPMEYQKDELFSIFCGFEKPPPTARVRWEDTPYAKMVPKRRHSKN